jgi:hypothetical protein
MSVVYNKRIIFPNDEGGVSIIVPSPSVQSIDQIIKDVPEGKPYQIIDINDVPSDKTYRNAWTYVEEE